MNGWMDGWMKIEGLFPKTSNWAMLSFSLLFVIILLLFHLIY